MSNKSIRLAAEKNGREIYNGNVRFRHHSGWHPFCETPVRDREISIV